MPHFITSQKKIKQTRARAPACQNMKAGSSLHHGASMRPPIRMPSNPNDGGWNGAERLRWSGPPLPKEETMRLVTCFEAASRTTAELHVLYREAFKPAASAKPGSQAYENARLKSEQSRVGKESVSRVRYGWS